MGSPFLLPSSGQSLLSDDRQDSSPRDFCTVPHTPHIRGHWMTSDQSVPRTPDTPITTGQYSSSSGGQPGTPGNISMTNYHSVMSGLLVPELSQESPSTCPDQEVPATPEGGVIPSAFFQSSAPYNQPRTPQLLPLHSSQEATVPNVISNAVIITPKRREDGAEHCHRGYNVYERRRWQPAHTRQSPILSSRRRLSLEPVLATLNTDELNDQVNAAEIQAPQLNATTITNNRSICTPLYSDSGGSLQLPLIVGNNFLPNCTVNNEDEELMIDERRDCVHRASPPPGVSRLKLSANTISRTTTKLQRSGSSHHGEGIHTDRPISSMLPTASCEIPRHSSCHSNMEYESDDKRAEIERRVQKVLVGQTSTTRCTNSVLTLFEDDDIFA